ncbi:active breakpoint cluster region-related protein-like [Limulus polyphemus]|uniref:Active breakpoint cluster region-related protein-like n=1 Tax=Limulus polyphemus TaxID=6850 RepID=A0ABM1BC28_LIMPO|nr:active breakpoint cluster region-related protein-like [Limulus polyphemus]
MSVTNDFQTTWAQRFPDCELPQAWVEDVRANLIKHRERILFLKDEVEKEEFYVEYLEKLLVDAEKVKHLVRDVQGLTTSTSSTYSTIGAASSTPDARPSESESDLTEAVRAQNISHIDSISTTEINENITKNVFRNVRKSELLSNDTDTKLHTQSEQSSIKSELTVGEGKEVSSKTEHVTTEPSLQRSSYITVIEVGCNSSEQKAFLTTSITKSTEMTPTVFPEAQRRVSVLSNPSESSDNQVEIFSQKKKKPPTPPPKKPRQSLYAITPTYNPPMEKFDATFVNVGNASNFENIENKPVLVVGGTENMANSVENDLTQKYATFERSFSASSEKDELEDNIHTATVCTFSTFRPSVSSVNDICETDLNLKSHSSGTTSSHSSSSSYYLTQQVQATASTVESSINVGMNNHVQENEENTYSEEALYDTVAVDEDLELQNSVFQQDENSLQIETNMSFEEEDEDEDYVVFSECTALEYRDNRGEYCNQSTHATVTESQELQEQNGCGSPSFSTYVNIDYFLKNNVDGNPSIFQEEVLMVDSDDDGLHIHSLPSDQELDNDLSCSGGEARPTEAVRATAVTEDIFEVDSGVYCSSVDSASFLQPLDALGKWPIEKMKDTEHDLDLIKAEAERLTMQKYIINSTLESEDIYVDCLTTVLQYMKALKSNITTSQPLLSSEDFSVIFYKIPDLHEIHSKFLESLKDYRNDSNSQTSICESFKSLASKLDVYAAYLLNYSKAVETVRKCSLENTKFSELTRTMKLKSLKGQGITLEDLLHKPVARVQKNALVLHDLLHYIPESHPDYKTLNTALKLTQHFLDKLKLSTPESMFPAQDRAQRHLVKNSFIIELSEGHRKLRHLFLFNDVIVCAKYKPSTKQKFTFEVKWYIPLSEIVLSETEDAEDVRENSPSDVLTLKSRASTIRDQILKEKRNAHGKEKPKGMCRSLDKQKKKLSELEAQLVLSLPNLLFRVGHKNNRTYTFFLSSEFDKTQWIEAISVLHASVSIERPSLSLYELQTWITSCRKYLETNLGSFLLRSDKDEDLLVGDLHIVIHRLHGLTRPLDMFFCIEVDSYGHFFKKAKTNTSKNSIEPQFNEDFVIELEWSQTLRIFCYEDHPSQGNILRGKAALELSRSWLTDKPQEKSISLQEYMLTLSIKFVPSEMIGRWIPSSKTVGMFGVKIQQVCKKEKNTIPFIITSCVREVEKRGMNEVGIYRVSGSASDVQKLKKTFETNLYEAEQLLKEVDIHTVTGLLKLYLRELPDTLFTDALYPMFFEAFSVQDQKTRTRRLLSLFHSLPTINQEVLIKLVDHLVKVNQHESHNKMSLHSLATVFGPNVLRPGSHSTSSKLADLAASTVDVIAQAGILYFFLKCREAGLPLTVESFK